MNTSQAESEQPQSAFAAGERNPEAMVGGSEELVHVQSSNGPKQTEMGIDEKIARPPQGAGIAHRESCGDAGTQGRPGDPGELDALGALEMDHRRLEALFREYERAGKDKTVNRVLARAICMELRLHSLLEEEIFYPAFRKATGEHRLVQRIQAEHGKASMLMEEIEAEADAGGLMEQLQELVMRCLQEEREQIFPRARATPRLDLGALAGSLESRRAQLVDNVATN